MKKLWKCIDEKDIDIIVTICLIVIAAAFFLKINCYDELWNFANCYKMFEGYKIYRDLNVIITPLFFWLSQIFFVIFGGTILSFKIYNICISSIMLILIYKILRNLNIAKKRSSIYIFLITFILIGIIKAGANYNLLVFIPIFYYILNAIKNKENDFFTGILLFITFMIKQNVCIYFGIGILIYKIITSENLKRTIIDLMKICLTAALGTIIFISYLYFDNNLYDFIDYCFLGLMEFGSKNIIGNFFDMRYVCVSVIAVVFLLIVINNKKISENLNKEAVKNIKLLLCMGTPLILVAYPIFNYYHSTLGSLILIIGFIYAIEEAMFKEMFANSTKDKILSNVLMAILLLYSIYEIVYMIFTIYNPNYYFEKTHPFFGYIVTEDERKDIAVVCQYIRESNKKGIDVKILSYKANLYMVPLGKNNEKFDLANLGNLGQAGEDGLIKEIKYLKNAVILIQTEEDKTIIGQESKIVREYIINEFEKIGEIQEYSIYSRNEE